MTNTVDRFDEGTLVVTHADEELLLDSFASRGLVGCFAGGLYDLAPKVQVAFMQDNKLTHVPAISQLRNLSMLYLQDNNLVTTEDLKHLTALRKLDLEGNALQSLSGLSSLTNLTDLHVSRQRSGCSLEVEPEVVEALSVGLTNLRAASCQLHSISCFATLQRLQLADFSDNDLANEDDCFFFVESIPILQRLDVRGNRICQAAKLMDQAVLRGEHLVEFNGKQVKPQTREFLKRIVRVRARGEKAKSGGDASEDSHLSWPRRVTGIPRVEEARPHVNSNVAQLSIPSPGDLAVSFSTLKGTGKSKHPSWPMHTGGA